MKIALITDAWRPQINGVVTTLQENCQRLRARGHEVETYTPDAFRNWPCPGYPEIRLAIACGRQLSARLDRFQPDAVHIATEGPLGMAGRRWCLRHGYPFTTSFHTRFAEYVEMRTAIPASWIYRLLRWFHEPAARTLVATPALVNELKSRGFSKAVLWSRGVDTELFHPIETRKVNSPPQLLYVGRVAVEKNLEAFLQLDIPGRKIVVGDGPQRSELEEKYPATEFVGYRFGRELAAMIAQADVFVFPSLTDTFGLVMLEALACGTPVAAFPVRGPLDVIRDPAVGCLDKNLGNAISHALQLDRKTCRAYALGYSWDRCAQQMESWLEPIQRSPKI